MRSGWPRHCLTLKRRHNLSSGAPAAARSHHIPLPSTCCTLSGQTCGSTGKCNIDAVAAWVPPVCPRQCPSHDQAPPLRAHSGQCRHPAFVFRAQHRLHPPSADIKLTAALQFVRQYVRHAFDTPAQLSHHTVSAETCVQHGKSVHRSGTASEPLHVPIMPPATPPLSLVLQGMMAASVSPSTRKPILSFAKPGNVTAPPYSPRRLAAAVCDDANNSASVRDCSRLSTAARRMSKPSKTWQTPSVSSHAECVGAT